MPICLVQHANEQSMGIQAQLSVLGHSQKNIGTQELCLAATDSGARWTGAKPNQRCNVHPYLGLESQRRLRLPQG